MTRKVLTCVAIAATVAGLGWAAWKWGERRRADLCETIGGRYEHADEMSFCFMPDPRARP